MKEYTTGEMILALEKNPKLTFESESPGARGKVQLNESGAIVWNSSATVVMSLAYANLQAKWTLVRTPVTWQEAIQAWVDGKMVKAICSEDCPAKKARECSIANSVYHPISNGNTMLSFCVNQAKCGQWHILEGDADE